PSAAGSPASRRSPATTARTRPTGAARAQVLVDYGRAVRGGGGGATGWRLLRSRRVGHGRGAGRRLATTPVVAVAVRRGRRRRRSVRGLLGVHDGDRGRGLLRRRELREVQVSRRRAVDERDRRVGVAGGPRHQAVLAAVLGELAAQATGADGHAVEVDRRG